jgi:hypothetical protein
MSSSIFGSDAWTHAQCQQLLERLNGGAEANLGATVPCLRASA